MKLPKVVCILGAQWGDEGKGKIVDMMVANGFDIVARCQGGNNAGHTVVVGEKVYDFHMLPSGIIHPQSTSLIGNGVVLHLPSLFEELKKNGIAIDSSLTNRLIISDRAQLVFDLHQKFDGLQEAERRQQGKTIGTTQKGIGPAYATKHFRNGVRVGDLMGDEADFRQKFLNLYNYFKRQYPSIDIDVEAELNRYKGYAELLRSLGLVKDTVYYLHDALNSNSPRSLLIEGANGALLDIDFGTYPYVTSSSPCVGGALTGLGISFKYVTDVIGIVKAYQTRVGDGPFPTEQQNEIGDKLRAVGHEYGVTTGRPRRCGWLDLVLLKYSHIINGFTGFALTKLDILDEFDEIKIAVKYRIRGQLSDHVPGNSKDLFGVEVIYETLPGWKKNTSGARNFEMLPREAQAYVKFIESYVGVPVRWIGVGKDRNSLIVR